MLSSTQCSVHIPLQQQLNTAPTSSWWHLAQNKSQLYKICVYFLSSSFDLNICLREFQTESKAVFAVR